MCKSESITQEVFTVSVHVVVVYRSLRQLFAQRFLTLQRQS